MSETVQWNMAAYRNALNAGIIAEIDSRHMTCLDNCNLATIQAYYNAIKVLYHAIPPLQDIKGFPEQWNAMRHKFNEGIWAIKNRRVDMTPRNVYALLEFTEKIHIELNKAIQNRLRYMYVMNEDVSKGLDNVMDLFDKPPEEK